MYRPHLSTTLYFFTFLGLCQVVTKGSNTLGDKFQQNVAMTNHSLRTGPAKSCSNTLPRQIISCVLESKFLWKSLSLEQNFVAATSRKNSNDTEFVQLVALTKLCYYCENLCLWNRILLVQPVVKNQMILNLCNLLHRQNSVSETKIFTKIIQYTRSDLLLWCVAVTCCCNLLASAYWP